MLPNTLTILGREYTRAAEDTQTGTKYVPTDAGMNNRVSLSVRKVSSDTQAFYRWLLSYRAPCTVSNPAALTGVSESPTAYVQVNTTITLPKVFVPSPTEGDPGELLRAISAAMQAFIEYDASEPTASIASDFGSLLLAGHQ